MNLEDAVYQSLSGIEPRTAAQIAQIITPSPSREEVRWVEKILRYLKMEGKAIVETYDPASVEIRWLRR